MAKQHQGIHKMWNITMKMNKALNEKWPFTLCCYRIFQWLIFLFILFDFYDSLNLFIEHLLFKKKKILNSVDHLNSGKQRKQNLNDY